MKAKSIALFAASLLVIYTALLNFGLHVTHNELSPETDGSRSNITILTRGLQCPNISNIHNNSVIIYNRTSFGLKHPYPSYLFSFGGSGNTWSRVLIEYITGISSGAVFGDHKYINLFNQDNLCHSKLLICKAHPIWFYDQQNPNALQPLGTWKSQLDRERNASGLVWLVRDPWKSIWSLFQLRMNQRGTGHIAPDRSICLTESWISQFRIAHMLLNENQIRKWNNNKSRVAIIKYEYLLKESMRYNEIKKILKHLYKFDGNKFPIPVDDDSLKYIDYGQLMKRIECAFSYKQNDAVFHRKHNDNKTEPETEYITMIDAYKSIGAVNICKIWFRIKYYALQFGYKQLFYQNFRCEEMDYFKNDKNNQLPNYLYKFTDFNLSYFTEEVYI